jgi:hypothetical protein
MMKVIISGAATLAVAPGPVSAQSAPGNGQFNGNGYKACQVFPLSVGIVGRSLGPDSLVRHELKPRELRPG